MRFRWLLIFVFLCSVQPAFGMGHDLHGHQHNWIDISELNDRQPEFGVYTVVGYVVKIYECPPCPPDAYCKPCMPPNIVISERNSELAQYALTNQELLVFTTQEQSDELRMDRPYRFLLQVLDVKTTDQAINNVKLIHFERQ